MDHPPAGLSRRLQSLASALDPGPGDGELLRRWHAGRDEAAFAELVRRHGRLVWGVCHRGCADPDDAYQAVFLLLARRAGRLSGRRDVAGWLYVTAGRMAARAARTAARRRARERMAARPEATALPAPNDWGPALDAAVRGLPARYRDAVVLCELGGVPRAVAAERLGVPVGTLASRLAAARALLRRRLVRRGVTLGTLAAVGEPPAVTAGVAGVAARQLARGVTAMATLKILAAGVMTAGVLAGAGYSSGLGQQPTIRPVAPAATQPPTAPAVDAKAEALRLYDEGLTLSREGTYPQAVAKFTDSIRLNPDFPEAYFSRAAANTQASDFRTRDYAAAVADLSKYVARRPDDHGGRFNRGMALKQLDRDDEAITDFTRLLDGPTDFARNVCGETPEGRTRLLASVRYYRAEAYAWGKNDPGMAIADYMAAERLNPKMGEPGDGYHPQWYRGVCYRRLRQYAPAAAALREAARRQPAHGPTLDSLGWLLATCPDAAVRTGKEAVTVAERALAVRPGEWRYLETLAAAHAEVGDFPAAVRRQTEAVAKRGDGGDPAERQRLADRLAAYQGGQPWREP